VTRLPRRLILTMPALLIVLTACGTTAPTEPNVPPSRPSESPVATPVDSDAPSATPDQGNVDPEYPELAVEVGDGYVISITDPAAKAWRWEVRGPGVLAEDRLEIVVEVGDITPGAEARIYKRGSLVDVFDMNGMVGDDTVAAGGCHPTLQVCFGSDGLTIDPQTGRASLVLERVEPVQFAVQGATAGWPGEPFILGPWRTTEPYSTY